MAGPFCFRLPARTDARPRQKSSSWFLAREPTHQRRVSGLAPRLAHYQERPFDSAPATISQAGEWRRNPCSRGVMLTPPAKAVPIGSVTRWALYDLRSCPPSFDFLTFLVLAKNAGAEGVLFIPGMVERKFGQYGPKEQLARVGSIVFPACDLYGMPYKSIPPNTDLRDLDIAWPPYAKASPKTIMAGYVMGWLKSVKSPEPFMPSEEALDKVSDRLKGKSIVVHLRWTPYHQERNSSEDWKKWASDHDAYVLEDNRVNLDERCAFHELAKLNFGVNAGHMALSLFSSHRPYISLSYLLGNTVSTSQEWFARQGWYPGDQYPWAGPHQVLEWGAKDDYNSIESAYQSWLANNP